MLRLCPLRVHLRWGVPSQAQQPYRLVEFAARRSFRMTTRKRESGVECAVEDDPRPANGNGEGADPVAKEAPSESTPAKKRRKSKKEPEPAGPAYDMSMRPEKVDSTMLHVMSWNVAGMRALLKKDAGALKALVEREQPDVLCLQETKLQDSHISDVTKQMALDGWTAHWSCSQARKGYSGTAMLCRKPPLAVSYGIGTSEHDQEGRVIAVELPEAHVVNVYVPHAGDGLKRLDYRVGSWDKDFSAYLRKLEESKPVIVAGDMNCAHQEIDIHNPAGNLRSAGFTQEERDSFTDSFLNHGFLDTFRLQHPGVVGYTYYGYRGGMRAKGKGWRLDYLLASQVLRQHLYDSYILTDVMGSDHLPLGLVLKPL